MMHYFELNAFNILIDEVRFMLKKVIAVLLSFVLCVCAGFVNKVNAESVDEVDHGIIQIHPIPSLDPVVGKLKISDSKETIVLSFNDITKEFTINGSTYTPDWWPGNPNPQPGSEDWLFQHYSPNLGSTAPKGTVSTCLVSIGFDLTWAAVTAFFKTGPWNLKRFVTYFGTTFAVSYANCLVSKGFQ